MPHLSAYRKSQLCFCPTPLSQTYLTTITSIIPIAMLIIGMGIVMVPPMILEALYSYSPDNETVIEEATNSPLMMSYFSFCTSYSRFNWTRLLEKVQTSAAF